MPIIEDAVNQAVATYLKSQGYTDVDALTGNAAGWDVSGVCPNTNRTLVVESKGEAHTGNQWSRSWNNAATAVFTALNEKYGKRWGDEKHDVAIALPHTEDYLKRFQPLRLFFADQGIKVFWVKDDSVSDIWS